MRVNLDNKLWQLTSSSLGFNTWLSPDVLIADKSGANHTQRVQFKEFLTFNLPGLRKRQMKILLAVSGGMDSMYMLARSKEPSGFIAVPIAISAFAEKNQMGMSSL